MAISMRAISSAAARNSALPSDAASRRARLAACSAISPARSFAGAARLVDLLTTASLAARERPAGARA
jgi:hypothetical protein